MPLLPQWINARRTFVGVGGLAAARSRSGSDNTPVLSFKTLTPLRYHDDPSLALWERCRIRCDEGRMQLDPAPLGYLDAPHFIFGRGRRPRRPAFHQLVGEGLAPPEDVKQKPNLLCIFPFFRANWTFYQLVFYFLKSQREEQAPPLPNWRVRQKNKNIYKKQKSPAVAETEIVFSHSTM